MLSEERRGAASSFAIPTLFGTTLRADVLTLVTGLGRSYPRELATLVGKPVSMVQRAVESLERAGVLRTRLIGRQREISLNPEYMAANELNALLRALVERDPRTQRQLAAASRRRPRRTGKAM